MIEAAHQAGLVVEGLSFHVGSQTTNFENYVQALNLAAGVFREAADRGFHLKLIDIGGGFPPPTTPRSSPSRSSPSGSTPNWTGSSRKNIEILAEPGRFLVATAGTAIAKVIGKARRDGKRCYYLDDGVYHTFSGIIFDHCQYHLKALKDGPTEICSVFGPTCDALDTISLAEELPELDLGDYVYSRNIGAYSHASSTWFNGFPPAKVVHINR